MTYKVARSLREITADRWHVVGTRCLVNGLRRWMYHLEDVPGGNPAALVYPVADGLPTRCKPVLTTTHYRTPDGGELLLARRVAR